MADLRADPHEIRPVDSDGDSVADGSYGFAVVGGKVQGMVEVATPSGGGTITYGQTGKTMTVASTSLAGSNWRSLRWFISHHKYLKVSSFSCTVFTSETYKLFIDGLEVASAAATGGAAPYSLTLTPASPIVLPPGTHAFAIRGTAARRFYYSNSQDVVPTGTYPDLVWSAWDQPDVVATPAGTLTFDAEGVLT